MTLIDRRRVAIVVNSLQVRAGVEARTLELAAHLLRRGDEVAVFALRAVGPIAEHYRALGIQIHFVPVYSYAEGSGEYTLSVPRILRLWWMLLKRRYGVIFCVQPPSSLFARLAVLPKLGRRVVAMERFLADGRSKRRLILERLLATWTDCIVCVSTLLAEQVAASTGISQSKIIVVEDGVAIEPTHSRLDELRRWANGRFHFGFVGLLTQRKRPDLLLRAFAKVHATTQGQVALTFVGTGEDMLKLQAAANQLGLSDAVHFAGEQNYPHDYYRLFDAFAFPSVKEGLGNVWIEAMLHQLPIICARVRPMQDYIIHEQNGLLTPPDDVEALSHAMLRLITDTTLREYLGKNAAIYAQLHFDRERQLTKLVTLVESE